MFRLKKLACAAINYPGARIFRMQKHIFLTVTNDLTYDQRMQRICTSLAKAGYKVTLVGRELKSSAPLTPRPFAQVRLHCSFSKGKMFYAEYNYKLYRFLVHAVAKLAAGKTVPPAAICAIDLDTILPCLWVSKAFKLPRVYDAHELFSELTEIKRRPVIYKIWSYIERKTVPQYQFGYSVNQFIVDELQRRFGVRYEVIRNLPVRRQTDTTEVPLSIELPAGPFFLYQGAVNEGRSFETLIPAMKMVDAPLVIAGDGNFFEAVKKLVADHHLEKKVFLLGYVQPEALKQITPLAYAGITLFENTGLNQYHSLANRFFDYINAGIPQLCVHYPEYAAIQERHSTALLIDELSAPVLQQH